MLTFHCIKISKYEDNYCYKLSSFWLSFQAYPGPNLFHASMDENSAWQPLLAEDGGSEGGFLLKSAEGLKLFLSYGLKLLMAAIFVTWVAFIFLLPTHFMGKLLAQWISITNTTVYGISGIPFLLFSAPVLATALLGAAYLSFFPTERKKKRTSSSRTLWTHPVIVNGPLGVVSAAELIGIIAFAVYILWALPAYIIRDITSGPFLAPRAGLDLMASYVGRRLAAVGFYCTAFLLIPTARGSLLLRVLDIPFEQAIRYHRRLGHVTLILFTLHGVVFIISWARLGLLPEKIIEWKTDDVSHFPGVISLLAGLLMWVTSVSRVRRKSFELFYYTHQLYVVFIIFAALHVGINLFYIIAGSVFLFIMDRFLRFWQSRATVDVLSVKCFPCGAVELTLSKPKNMRYNPLSFVFLQVREVSWFQWHPFSVCSSPLDGRLQLTVLIKVSGRWTQKLRDTIMNAKNHAKSRISAAVEGSYGCRSLYHLQYENLVLVAGGIGISPFIAVLKDIIHRAQEEKDCLPRKILLVWSVKRSKEISLLSDMNTTSISAFFPKVLNIEIQAYVTQESGILLEDGNYNSGGEIVNYFPSTGNSMSTLVGSWSAKWLGIYMFSSIFGFIALEGLAEFVLEKINISISWLNAVVCIICMLASVILFGGPVIMLWRRQESSELEFDVHKENNDAAGLNSPTEYCEDASNDLLALVSTHYGQRPNYKEIFSSTSEKWGKSDVGVLVCGPPGLESSVAAECRNICQPVFHFHSLSFEF